MALPDLHMISIMSQGIEQIFDKARILPGVGGQHLFRKGDVVTVVHLVVAGEVTLQRVTETGAVLTLQRAGPGDVLAEASIYADRYHCDGVVVQETSVKALPIAVFRRALAADPTVSEQWAKRLAEATQAARMQAEVRSLRTVAARLDAWLSLSGDLPAKGRWQDVASEIGVSREALYRELARRR